MQINEKSAYVSESTMFYLISRPLGSGNIKNCNLSKKIMYRCNRGRTGHFGKVNCL